MTWLADIGEAGEWIAWNRLERQRIADELRHLADRVERGDIEWVTDGKEVAPFETKTPEEYFYWTELHGADLTLRRDVVPALRSLVERPAVPPLTIRRLP